MAEFIFYATNRSPDPGAPGGYGIVPAESTLYGAASSVTVGAGAPAVVLAWPPAPWSAGFGLISDSPLPVVIFIHGLGYKFSDVITQCATMKALYAAQGADATWLAYDWCESGQEVGGVFSLEQPYLGSQAQARAVAPLLAEFLANIAAMRESLPASCPVMIMCHSMGTYALAAALDLLPAGTAQICDRICLIAADEEYDTFEMLTRTRLVQLPALVKGSISIYFGRHDGALLASAAVNGIQRLGFDGPKDRADSSKFPIDKFRLIDCTRDERGGILNPGETHSYYLTDADTIADISAVILGQDGPVGTVALDGAD